MLNRPFKTISNFRLTNMNIKVTRAEIPNSNDQSDFFAGVKGALDRFQNATLSEIPSIVDQLSTLNEIETLEITNPDNGNGFSINMKETNV
jgi:hypothetical protein